MSHFEKCPTCGGPCDVTWRGLDLVSETGDETLASKNYASINAELLEALERMEDLFNHSGVFGLIESAKRYGWAHSDVEVRVAACHKARAAIAKAKGESP